MRILWEHFWNTVGHFWNTVEHCGEMSYQHDVIRCRKHFLDQRHQHLRLQLRSVVAAAVAAAAAAAVVVVVTTGTVHPNGRCPKHSRQHLIPVSPVPPVPPVSLGVVPQAIDQRGHGTNGVFVLGHDLAPQQYHRKRRFQLVLRVP